MTKLNLAHIEADCDSIAPERVHGIWVQGCAIHCRGCHVPDLWPFRPANLTTPAEVMEKLTAERARGIALLGGEPLNQAIAVRGLLQRARAQGMGTTLYTGYERDVVLHRHPWITELVDLLIAGPFVESRRCPGTEYRGSDNQTLDWLTTRYRREEREVEPCEVHIGEDGRLFFCGFADPELVRSITEGGHS
ncbi:MAG TPA: 4Fe-4S single cluster domain-containing protein [Spirochaetia bacterium]|nr:4Fe-4S single cluster domain-containing protein [Spirochaetia bacterium]